IGKKPAPMVADFGSLIKSGSVYVAKDADADLIGFIVFYQKGDCFMLENVAVHSNATGKGVGKRLITFCEEQAKQSGVTSVKLYTNEKMSENLSIYPHLGYRETGRRTEDGFNRVFFEKSL
ncbi:MAG: GNAT family N-acetyltransferase, partial [Defluviimonas sp.]|nr:GNAT family N-acetyltransferase [Defluviimonas sp.]